MNKKHIFYLTLLSITLQSSARVPLVGSTVEVFQKHPYLSGVALGATVASSAKVRETLKPVASALKNKVDWMSYSLTNNIINPVGRKVVNSRAYNASCAFMRQLLHRCFGEYRWCAGYTFFNFPSIHMRIDVTLSKKGLNELVSLRESLLSDLNQDPQLHQNSRISIWFRDFAFELTLDEMKAFEKELSRAIDWMTQYLDQISHS